MLVINNISDSIYFRKADDEVCERILYNGRCFLMPGNVTPVAEANFHGDPIASQLVMQNAKM